MNKPESRRAPALAHGELESFLRAEFPQVFNACSGLFIEEMAAHARSTYFIPRHEMRRGNIIP